MNNIDNRNSDETSLDFVNIARCISHRHPNIEVIVSELLRRPIHWSTQIVKIKKINACLKDYYNIFTKITFMSQDKNWLWQTTLCITTVIITIAIILLSPIIIDQRITSCFFTQAKHSFSSNTFPIIFITITVSHTNTLQPEMSIFFA